MIKIIFLVLTFFSNIDLYSKNFYGGTSLNQYLSDEDVKIYGGANLKNSKFNKPNFIVIC